MANKYTNISQHQIIQEMKTEAIVRYQFIPIRMAIIKNQNKETKTPQKIARIGKHVKKLELLCTINGKVKW